MSLMAKIVNIIHSLPAKIASLAAVLPTLYLMIQIPIAGIGWCWRKIRKPVFWTSVISLIMIAGFLLTTLIALAFQIKLLASVMFMVSAFTALIIGKFGTAIGISIARAANYGHKNDPKSIVAEAKKLGLDTATFMGRQIQKLFNPILTLSCILAFLSLMIIVWGFNPLWTSQVSVMIIFASWLFVTACVQGADVKKLYWVMNRIAIVSLIIYLGNLVVPAVYNGIKNKITSSQNEFVLSKIEAYKKFMKENKAKGANDRRYASSLETAAIMDKGIIQDSISHLDTLDTNNQLQTVEIDEFKIRRHGKDTTMKYLLAGDEVLVTDKSDSLIFGGVKYYQIRLPDENGKTRGKEYLIEAGMGNIQIVDGHGKNGNQMMFGLGSSRSGSYASASKKEATRITFSTFQNKKMLKKNKAYYLGNYGNNNFNVYKVKGDPVMIMVDGTVYHWADLMDPTQVIKVGSKPFLIQGGNMYIVKA